MTSVSLPLPWAQFSLAPLPSPWTSFLPSPSGKKLPFHLNDQQQQLKHQAFFQQQQLMQGQPLAQMGATVTRVDAIEKNIKIARLHASKVFS
ncbi:hypothetical protein K1719_033970 [Acacia pycnantha]|nr:hypothetical protein K1719_033970 [Acacia pycnantha]